MRHTASTPRVPDQEAQRAPQADDSAAPAPLDPLLVPTRRPVRYRNAAGLLAALDADQAALQNQQAALLPGPHLESTYQAALQAHAFQVQQQAERLAQRLQKAEEDTAKRIAKLHREKPGPVSFPSTKRAWSHQLHHEEATLDRIQRRQERVRAIRDGVIPGGGSRVEQLARERLRFEVPTLCRLRDEWCARERETKALARSERTGELSGPRRGLSLRREQP